MYCRLIMDEQRESYWKVKRTSCGLILGPSVPVTGVLTTQPQCLPLSEKHDTQGGTLGPEFCIKFIFIFMWIMDFNNIFIYFGHQNFLFVVKLSCAFGRTYFPNQPIRTFPNTTSIIGWFFDNKLVGFFPNLTSIVDWLFQQTLGGRALLCRAHHCENLGSNPVMVVSTIELLTFILAQNSRWSMLKHANWRYNKSEGKLRSHLCEVTNHASGLLRIVGEIFFLIIPS